MYFDFQGQDDMRVDAVMQQVFTIMNKLLSENKKSSKRKLLIRTYKVLFYYFIVFVDLMFEIKCANVLFQVVPLSQRSGVLEWCTNTISLGEYLCWRPGSEGAHCRFRPKDTLTYKARDLIKVKRSSIIINSKRWFFFQWIGIGFYVKKN